MTYEQRSNIDRARYQLIAVRSAVENVDAMGHRIEMRCNNGLQHLIVGYCDSFIQQDCARAEDMGNEK